jgi:hypothetical protein
MLRSSLLRTVVAALGLLIFSGPAMAQLCVNPAERTAFEVRALQSQLVVAALACGKDNDYNIFVRRFQTELSGSYRTIQGHFRRGGANSQRTMDTYITTLANAHSQDGINQGSRFCPNISPLFQVVMSQPDAAALAGLVAERNLINPLETPACPEAPARRAPARSAAAIPAR